MSKAETLTQILNHFLLTKSPRWGIFGIETLGLATPFLRRLSCCPHA